MAFLYAFFNFIDFYSIVPDSFLAIMADQEEQKAPSPEQKPGSPVIGDKPPTPEQQEEKPPTPEAQVAEGDRKSPTEGRKSADDAGRKSKSPVQEEVTEQKSQSPVEKEGAGDADDNQNAEGGDDSQKEEPPNGILLVLMICFFFWSKVKCYILI